VRSDEMVAFGLATGGVLCARCQPGQPHVTKLPGETLSAMRVLASPGPDWRDLEPSAGLELVRSTVGKVISHALGRQPRLLPYLGA